MLGMLMASAQGRALIALTLLCGGILSALACMLALAQYDKEDALYDDD